MLAYPAFHLAHGIRTEAMLGTPKLNDLEKLELPKGSIYHYLGNGVDTGPANDEPIARDPDRMVFIEHIKEYLDNPERLLGTPRYSATAATTLETDFKKRFRRFRPVRRIESVLADPRILLIENYAMLPHLYRYTVNVMSNWWAWKNQMSTVCQRANQLAEQSNNQQWLMIDLPKVLPSLSQLHLAEKVVNRTVLETFNDSDEYFLIDFFTFIGKTPELSSLSNLSAKALQLMNVIWMIEGKWMFVNLGELVSWISGRGEASGGVGEGAIQTQFLKGITELFETKTLTAPVVTSDAPLDVKADLNATGKIVISDVAKVQTIETGIVAKGNEMAEIGMLSGAEYRRVQKLAEVYKTIPNPYGKGTFQDLLVVRPEDMALPITPAFKDTSEVIDKTMLVSKLHEFDAHYLKTLYRKDIAAVIAEPQKSGVAVTNYKVERVVDAMGGYEIHSVQFTPVVGAPSTCHFKLPIINDRGEFTANGVKYRLRRQRGDMPIRKTKPNQVALTSYTAKLFVTRSQRADSEYYRWFLNQIVMGGLDATNTNIADLKMAKVPNYDTKLPRMYAEMSERIELIKIKGIVFNFNYDKRIDVLGVDAVKMVESKGMVACGKRGSAIVSMDATGALYTCTHVGDYTPIGTLEELVEVDLTKAPLEKVTLGIYGQELPIGYVLGYLLGFNNLLKLLKVKYRRVAFGTRTQLQSDEWTLRFKDETLVFNRNDKMATMVLGSLRLFKNTIIDYPVDSFDNKEVYSSVLEKEGITLRYVRELKTLNQHFIDPITAGLLKDMGEPTIFGDLLMRSCELLQTNDCPDEVDTTQMRIKGYERIAAAVHTEIMKAMRIYASKPATAKASIDIPPNAVWKAIQEDPAIGLVEESNPIHNLKELEIVTYNGTGGRSARSMVKRTRKYHQNDMGVISEATVDSGDVGIISYLSADPGLTNMRGVVKPWDGKEINPAQLVSTSMLVSPCADVDDGKRINFINIQQSSCTGAIGYKPMPLRTGYDGVLAQRASDLFAFTAKQDGKVLDVNDNAIKVEYKDGSIEIVELGRRFGTVTGTIIPHDVKPNVKIGERFKLGDLMAYNDSFFTPNPMSPTDALWKAGVPVRTAIFECNGTLEDSSMITQATAEQLATYITKPRTLVLKFEQGVRDLVKVGQELDVETILCTIEDSVAARSDVLDEASVRTLKSIASQTPRAKYHGKVERIEVFYNGDIEDMSESLQAIAKAGDKDRIKRNKALEKEGVLTGRVDSSMRIDGNPLDIDHIAIKLYLTGLVPAAVGDKGVFGNQLKTIFGTIMDGVNSTANDDVPIDAVFGYKSIFNRIVLSPQLQGTTNVLLGLIGKATAKAYYGE